MQRLFLSLVIAVVLSGCAQSSVSPSARTDLEGAGQDDLSLTCDVSLGTLAIVEKPDEWLQNMQENYGVQSTLPILQTIVMHSGCFDVVEIRAETLDNTQQAITDYTLMPKVIVGGNLFKGIGVGGILGSVSGLIGGSVSFKKAQSELILRDNRINNRISTVTGDASGIDFGAFGADGGADLIAGLSVYTQTGEGRAVVASLLDAYNRLVAESIQGKL